MISKAAWAGTSHRVGADMVDVPRGSFMETLRNMQSTFMWASDKRVRNFLKKLENHGMITVLSVGKRNARKTHVTIRNYEEYQSGGRSKDAAKTHDGRSGDAVKKQGNKVTSKDTYVSLGQFDLPEENPPPKKPVKRATQLPDGWLPSDRNIQDAISKQFSTEDISHEADQFRDYHLAKGSTYKDWNAAWRTWLGNARKFAGNRSQGQRNGSSRGHIISDAVREAGLRGFD